MTDLAGLFALGVAWIVGGLMLGLLYFTELRWSVDLYSASKGRVVPALLTVGRFAAAILFFGFSVRVGALPLLASFLGFLAARGLALHAVRRTA
jgi:F1-F0 ATPase (N-ATPase) AtpR subunit